MRQRMADLKKKNDFTNNFKLQVMGGMNRQVLPRFIPIDSLITINLENSFYLAILTLTKIVDFQK
jgi:hypothetical protein